MPTVDQPVVEEGRKRLIEAGMLEQTENVRPVTSPGGYALGEGREDTPFTKTTSITKKSSGCCPLQANADDRWKGTLAYAHYYPRG